MDTRVGERTQMKRPILISVTIVLLVVFLVTGCTRVISPRLPRTLNITAGVDQEFVIALGSSPTTGYSWRETHDETMVELVEKSYKPKENAEETVIGGEGVDYFKFKTLKTGQTEITLSYERSWEIGWVDKIVYAVAIKQQ